MYIEREGSSCFPTAHWDAWEVGTNEHKDCELVWEVSFFAVTIAPQTYYNVFATPNTKTTPVWLHRDRGNGKGNWWWGPGHMK